MHTDAIPQGTSPLRLDDIKDEANFQTEMQSLEKRPSSLVYVEASLESADRISSTLCSLRASNLAAILVIRPTQPTPSLEELSLFLGFLKEWDQLLLYNVLQICADFVIEKQRGDLRAEARIEMKWFQEWLTASHDERIAKYPGLPWRSFIRKTVQENFAFAQDLLQLSALVDSQERETAVIQLTQGFLKNKKKAISFFPKRWSKLQ